MIYKNRLPFKIGCTSYVIPDAILPNVELMADFVDDIELLFFESFNQYNQLKQSELSELNEISNKKNLSYSVHCPIDCNTNSFDSTERDCFIEQVKLITDMTCNMNISGYVLHFNGIDNVSSEEETIAWKKNVFDVCNKIGTFKKLNLSKICIENINYKPQLNVDIVNRFGFSLCLDMGHLWLNSHEWKKTSSEMIPKTKIIHLHGVNNHKDHLSLALHNPELLTDFVKTILFNYCEVLTIELFNKKDTFESLECIRTLWEKLH